MTFSFPQFTGEFIISPEQYQEARRVLKEGGSQAFREKLAEFVPNPEDKKAIAAGQYSNRGDGEGNIAIYTGSDRDEYLKSAKKLKTAPMMKV